MDVTSKSERHEDALALLRRLRRQDALVGVRHSGIAFDIGLLLYEHAIAEQPQPVSVDMLAAASSYSGPTVRLVLKRLMEAGTVQPARRLGKTQLYSLTPSGLDGFNGYVQAVLVFAASYAGAYRDGAVTAADGSGLPPNPPAGPAPPPGRYADGRPGPEAAC